jgi:hypothetical protein
LLIVHDADIDATDASFRSVSHSHFSKEKKKDRHFLQTSSNLGTPLASRIVKKQVNAAAKGHLIRGAFYLLLLAAICVIPFALGQRQTGGQRTLTFAERIAYQRALKEVFWRHRIWPKERPDPKPSLDAVMSSAAFNAAPSPIEIHGCPALMPKACRNYHGKEPDYRRLLLRRGTLQDSAGSSS